MADILIWGMEMPKDHPILVFIWPDGRLFPYGLYKSSEWDRVKAVSLPEGHGRLIDADALFETMRYHRDHAELNEVMLGLDEAVGVVKDAPTIVPAEGGEADA